MQYLNQTIQQTINQQIQVILLKIIIQQVLRKHQIKAKMKILKKHQQVLQAKNQVMQT